MNTLWQLPLGQMLWNFAIKKKPDKLIMSDLDMYKGHLFCQPMN